MQQQHSFKQIFLKYSYLLLAAAWLITISFIVDNYWVGNASLKAINKNISTRINKEENDFDALTKDTATLIKIASQKFDQPFLNNINSKPYFYYLYTIGTLHNYNLIFWNSQTILPSAEILSDTTAFCGFAKLSNGYYVWRKFSTLNFTSVALIPIKWNYSITNDYLKNSFAIENDIDNFYTIADTIDTKNVIKSKEGVSFFSIIQKSDSTIYYDNITAILCKILAAFLVLLFIHFMATYYVEKKYFTTISLLAIIIVILRTISYYISLL